VTKFNLRSDNSWY